MNPKQRLIDYHYYIYNKINENCKKINDINILAALCCHWVVIIFNATNVSTFDFLCQYSIFMYCIIDQ